VYAAAGGGPPGSGRRAPGGGLTGGRHHAVSPRPVEERLFAVGRRETSATIGGGGMTAGER